MTYIRYIFLPLLFILMVCSVRAVDSNRNYILVISSYNPETGQVSENLSSFMDEFKRLGGKQSVIIENMNCKSFSESVRWKDQMADILDKYTYNLPPDLIIILGQEAWSAYLSESKERPSEIPVMCGLVSRNAIILPTDTTNLREWQPESIDAFVDVEGCNIIAGYAYEYDIKKNVELIKRLYPNVKNLAFLSDNTYGGVSMQALVREEMEDFPDLNLIQLDGRNNSIYTIVPEITSLPDHTVLLVGTWRVDMNEGYFMRNSTYTLRDANPDIPTFSLATIGVGYWVIGGYMPNYMVVGKDMASQAYSYLYGDDREDVHIEFVSGHYLFDMAKLEELGIPTEVLPANADYVNVPESFFEQYKYQIIGVVSVFLFLVAGLLASLYYYFRAKLLANDLLQSEVELRKAKDRAEESNKLKTAFLANMSHEIRTPLNAIVGFSNVITSGDISQEEKETYFNIIQTNSDLLLNLINDILDISRLESGRIKFVYEDCDIVGLCRNVISTVIYTKKTKARFLFNTDLETYVIRTDIKRLQQVLINLLSNASKFTSEGTITLDFKIDEPTQMIIFSVTDTGCGIPEDKQKLIFERFEKLNEYAQGTGLGLSICKLIISVFGGNIWVDPTYKDGARFMFSHPLKIEEQEEE